ncbi:MAG: tRNA pseudouridine(13) synthase TruD [Phycisphaerales bacterium]|nr:tRNA pseudouridine(13) synthase TruD [Phycisphaerales bacterium]
MARLLLEERCPKLGYEVEDAFGAMLFMPLKDVPDPLLTLDLPLPGRGTQMAEPWRKAAEKVLREEGLNSLRQLRLPGLRRPFFGESPRQLFMQAGEFRLGPVENDSMTSGRKMRWVGFTLPRGGYATVVLRALGQ